MINPFTDLVTSLGAVEVSNALNSRKKSRVDEKTFI